MDYIVNARGAKIHTDINNHKFLPVPKVPSTSHNGTVYNVLSVGYHKSGKMMVTVKENEQCIAYRLPNGLSEWGMNAMSVAQIGINPFPCDVEFGELPTRLYGEYI